MKLLDIAKRSTISMNKIKKISEEFDEKIVGLTKNLAQIHLIQALEKMMIYGDLYVYEGRFPIEEPEVINMDKEDLNFSRCLGRIRHEQLLCNKYVPYDYKTLISKSEFYYHLGAFYDKTDIIVQKYINEKKISPTVVEARRKEYVLLTDVIESYLLSDMHKREYEEWRRFFQDYAMFLSSNFD